MARSKKQDKLLEELKAGWCPAPTLASKFGWQAHTLRGAISKLAKTRNVTVERRREKGINEYRVGDVPSAEESGAS